MEEDIEQYEKRMKIETEAYINKIEASTQARKTLIRPLMQCVIGLAWLSMVIAQAPRDIMLDIVGFGCIVELIGERVVKNSLDRLSSISSQK